MSVNTNMNSNPIPQRQATGSSFSSNMVVAPAGPNPLAARGASYAYDQDASRTASRNVSATTNQPYSPSGPNGSYGSAPSSMASRHGHNVNGTNGLPNQRDGALPVAPVFGVTLENLFRRDESAVPMVVYQCIQAIDLFGLKVEGIYRLSGNASHMAQLKNLFNHSMSLAGMGQSSLPYLPLQCRCRSSGLQKSGKFSTRREFRSRSIEDVLQGLTRSVAYTGSLCRIN